MPFQWNIEKPWARETFNCEQLNWKAKYAFNDQDEFDDRTDLLKCQQDWFEWLTLEGFELTTMIANSFHFQLLVIYELNLKIIKKQDGPQRAHSWIATQD